ncbi:M20 family metallopeptidase [Nonomuraea africana]|uniref:Glutamate carboxypeptidase n=1 Tax=Nonomuraea africana TaxID=46171 RepID=A0ABR9KE35_9ACTN|nr:M20 family metallopeptidase [Nonomuraea africana]MBE1559948.1 glutamate carboxypeptidase [Nonomuraea africana]
MSTFLDVRQMVRDLELLVTCESPSGDVKATMRAADVLTEIAWRITGCRPDVVTRQGRPHLLWRFGGRTKVLLVGHLDTVWPLGTLDRWPFEVQGDLATGPGCFDMKAGLVQALHAVATLDDLDGVTLLVTTDEELGSPTSRAWIEEQARGATAAFVLEASADGALKVQRKGVSLYDVLIGGRAAHAGLEPHKGVNAAVELAHQVLAVQAFERGGTTVTPTVVGGGTTTNTVPAHARFTVDVRAETVAEQARVDAAFGALRPRLEGASIEVVGGPNRPPLEAARSRELFTRAVRLARRLGLPELTGVAVGGGSDGNFTAGIGVPTLDGMGAVGDHAHAEGEYVVISAMAERAALLAALIDDVRAG